MSSFDFSGRVAVVTGGTTGIGFAAARQFSQAGAQVVLTGQDEGRLASARQALPGVLALRADARRVADAQALAEHVRQAHGRVDALFLNAGIFSFRPLADITEDHVDELLDTNLKGVMFSLQALLPLIPEGGSVVLNASTVASKGVVGASVYTATKGALIAMARALAKELGPRGIRVNSISPGATHTDGLGKAGITPEAGAAITAEQPVARLGDPEEIAAAVLFLCSPHSRYTTGADLRVDGGYSA